MPGVSEMDAPRFVDCVRSKASALLMPLEWAEGDSPPLSDLTLLELHAMLRAHRATRTRITFTETWYTAFAKLLIIVHQTYSYTHTRICCKHSLEGVNFFLVSTESTNHYRDSTCSHVSRCSQFSEFEDESRAVQCSSAATNIERLVCTECVSIRARRLVPAVEWLGAFELSARAVQPVRPEGPERGVPHASSLHSRRGGPWHC